MEIGEPSGWLTTNPEFKIDLIVWKYCIIVSF